MQFRSVGGHPGPFQCGQYMAQSFRPCQQVCLGLIKGVRPGLHPTPDGEEMDAQTAGDLGPRQTRLHLEPFEPSREFLKQRADRPAMKDALTRYRRLFLPEPVSTGSLLSLIHLERPHFHLERVADYAAVGVLVRSGDGGRTRAVPTTVCVDRRHRAVIGRCGETARGTAAIPGF